MACDDKEISILFTDDKHIADLNQYYLNRNGPTNVLAFPMTSDPPEDIDSGMLGDVVISVNTAIRESIELGEPIAVTLYRLLIHGILHLLHFDHEKSPEDEKRMVQEEKRLLALVLEG